MSNYSSFNELRPCPYCKAPCHADFVDVGVGMVQCGPYHCELCGASEIGPYDSPRELSDKEKSTGWYAPGADPGSSANVINGKIVSHEIAKAVYRDLYPFSSTDEGKTYIRKNNPYAK